MKIITNVQDLTYGFVYPSSVIAPLVERFLNNPDNARRMYTEGWQIGDVDTDVPDGDYTREKDGTYYRIEANNEFWEKFGGNPYEDSAYDALAREAGIVVDKHGVVRGFENNDLVYDYNVGLKTKKTAQGLMAYAAEISAMIFQTLYPKISDAGDGLPIHSDYEGFMGATQLTSIIACEIANETKDIDWDVYLKDKFYMGVDDYVQQVALRKIEERYPTKKKFKVVVLRTSYQWAEFEVEAKDTKEAKRIALAETGNHAYTENDADYSVEELKEI
jgi:hypothetical protein